MDNHRVPGNRIRKLIGAGLATSAMVLAWPIGVAAADPVPGPGPTDPLITDYLDRVNALVEKFSGEDPSGGISAEEFNTILNVENARLIDAVIAAKLPH
jgi:hypothetical protein